MEESEANCASRPASHDLGRIVLFSFLLTFILARVVVFLIMSHRLQSSTCTWVARTYTISIMGSSSWWAWVPTCCWDRRKAAKKTGCCDLRSGGGVDV